MQAQGVTCGKRGIPRARWPPSGGGNFLWATRRGGLCGWRARFLRLSGVEGLAETYLNARKSGKVVE